jgi:hypothetical protein
MVGAILFLFLVFGFGFMVIAPEFRAAWARIAARVVGSVFVLIFLAAGLLTSEPSKRLA